MPAAAQARPVAFADSWMWMQMNDHMEHSLHVSYAPTAQYSLGVRSAYLRDEESWMHMAQYNRLLKRWNQPDSQANIFLLTGAGVAESGSMAPAGSVGIEADWEDRRYYISYENRAIVSSAIEESFSHKARLGIAPYIGGYNDLHTWLMVQVDHHPSGSDNVVVTPFVRLFNTFALAELGISNKRDIMFNLTLQY